MIHWKVPAFSKFVHMIKGLGLVKAAKPTTDTEILLETETLVIEQSHVYVHCYYNNRGQEILIRIWHSTYLVDSATGAKSTLVHAENISYAPQWTFIPDRKLFRFLLIFTALPKECVSFDLLEDIPQSGGFRIEGIARNKADIYHVDIA